MRGRWRAASLATRLFVQSAALLVATALAIFTLLGIDARADAEDDASDLSRDLVAALAADPSLVPIFQEANRTFEEDPTGTVARTSALLQPYADAIVGETRMDFVGFLHPSGIRYTHPRPEEVGRQYLGSLDAALEGGIVTETAVGTLGPSARAVAPVIVDGEVVGMVAAGVTIAAVGGEVTQRLWTVAAVTVVALLIAALTAWFFARRIRVVTGNRGIDELAYLFAAHEAVLHTVDDGLVLVDRGRIVLLNDRARDLLELGTATAPIDTAALPQTVQDVLRVDDDGVASVLVGHRSLVIQRENVRAHSSVATMLMLRDRTELSRISGELDTVRTLATALRAQTHEFGNRLHTIASLIELGEPRRALQVAAAERDLGQRLTDRVVSAEDEPVVAALLLGKTAQARERAVELHFETRLEPGTHWVDPIDFVTILGNLIDNAIDAAAASDRGGGDRLWRDRPSADRPFADRPWVEVYLGDDDDGAIVIQVSDSGAGVPESARELAFQQGWSTKDTDAFGRGFGLSIVRQTVERLGGSIDLGRGVGAVVTVVLPRPGGAS